MKVDNHSPENRNLFFLGLICMVLSLVLIGFSLYIFPFVFFGINYSMPEFVYTFAHWVNFHHDIKGFTALLLFYLPFLVTGLIFGYISKKINNLIEQQSISREDLHLDDNKKVKKIDKDTVRTTVQIGLLVLGVILLLFIFEVVININMIR